ncbi:MULTISPECIES: glycosyltransferase family 2 protein [unclassified Pseudodesulfovibrio]|uniref:glycosyltransferase family 2 protein n=1 Tax=unclassified Pseudodesulfovibrio TaxID=2661612 RepID=UPI000FEBBD6E|nr:MULTISPECIES: glycosyltransferase family 2 protein [unclassified Pseudodesulfovibrio]MCJ2164996.1 glycosyltransferase family 2 protein [Pseudodesulfovibrio sp. S3-i]RWU03563.1 glycosyltransferase family 2 protein [Pseudodesulfovibrio sp. S3]
MYDYGKVAVILPALNESVTVGSVVDGALRHGCDVYVVNDNSADNTSEKALEAGAQVLTLPFTSGAWNAIQTGILYAVKLGKYEYFLTMDADGQHDPESIPALVACIESSHANVVVGSCPLRGSRARRCVWSLFTLLTRLKIRDMTSGLRLYDKSAVTAVLTREAAMYDYQDLEVLLLLRRRKMKIAELPVVMHPRRDGSSRVYRSWWAVADYMVRTCMGIVADWVSASGRRAGDWREYDSI